MLEQRTMVQQVPLASIADTVVTLSEVHNVPPGELHSQHVEQPGQSWDEWPTNSLWGALAGTQSCQGFTCVLCQSIGLVLKLALSHCNHRLYSCL